MRRLFFAALLAVAACHKPPADPTPKSPATLTILATGDVWGQVEPCG